MIEQELAAILDGDEELEAMIALKYLGEPNEIHSIFRFCEAAAIRMLELPDNMRIAMLEQLRASSPVLYYMARKKMDQLKGEQ